jgi:hypothetical protein
MIPRQDRRQGRHSGYQSNIHFRLPLNYLYEDLKFSWWFCGQRICFPDVSVISYQVPLRLTLYSSIREPKDDTRRAPVARRRELRFYTTGSSSPSTKETMNRIDRLRIDRELAIRGG